MNVGQILKSAASMLNVQTSEMIIDGEHMGIRAMNSARKRVEMLRDFETQKATVRLSVGVSGTNLSTAVLESDGATAADVKTVHMGYLRDATTDPTSYFPLYFDNKKTIATRAREVSDKWTFDEYDIRYRDDNELIINSDRLQLYQLGRVMYLQPQQAAATSVALDCTLWMSDYDYNYVIVTVSSTASPTVTLSGSFTAPANFQIGSTLLGQVVTNIAGSTVTLAGNASQTIATATLVTFSNSPVVVAISAGEQVRENYTDWFIEAGHEYLMWAVVVDLNHKFTTFVPRAEGYVNPPEKLRDQAMQALLLWDDSMMETSIQGIR